MFLEISNGMQEGKGANISKFDVLDIGTGMQEGNCQFFQILMTSLINKKSCFWTFVPVCFGTWSRRRRWDRSSI